MWLDIDFGEREIEIALLGAVKHLIGTHYQPLESAAIDHHC